MLKTKSPQHKTLAPGVRVSIRDEEWLIRSIDQTPTGVVVFGVGGLSPLVEGKARFPEDIKDLKTVTAHRTITDNSLSTGPVERTITYQAPFTKRNSGKDYQQVWVVRDGI